jgi:2,4-dienoyl-CoA reductase-like NADH-dependent reductase (Old Yellow Enzyme family)
VRAAGQLVVFVTGPVDQRRHWARQLAVAVHLGELLLHPFLVAIAGLGFDKAVPQHQVRKIQIEGMRRHIRAFGHEAHVAERAGFHDRLEIFGFQMLDIFLRAGVDQVE